MTWTLVLAFGRGVGADVAEEVQQDRYGKPIQGQGKWTAYKRHCFMRRQRA